MPDSTPSISVTLATPITDADMVLISLQGYEALSEPFDYTAIFRTAVSKIEPKSILGGKFVITLTNAQGIKQYINGIATEFVDHGPDGHGNTFFTVRLRPRMWMLSLQSDYKTFQLYTIPDIVALVLPTAQVQFRSSYSSHYEELEYTVQYGETGLAFVSRLMERAGITYYFEHSAQLCQMVLIDEAANYGDLPGGSTLMMGDFASSGDTGAVLDAVLQQSMVPQGYAVSDYNFLTPSTSLYATAGGKDGGLYEYPGNYSKVSEGGAIATLRLDEHEQEQMVLKGDSTVSTLHCGYKFALKRHPTIKSDEEWVVLSLRTSYTREQYRNEFTALPATVTYRPPRRTPVPRIHGTQTAIVTGDGEIAADAHGRVQVKFHWDHGTSTKASSSWVRVAQMWANNAFGAFTLPRVGSEVVVSFLDGNPDEPLIVGSVYNGENATPYSLPNELTKSTIKTNSSKGGGGFNELRFEDKAGGEELFIQAQKDMNVKIVKGDLATTVVAGKETHAVKTTRDVTVEGNESHTNKADFKQDVTGKVTIAIMGDEKHTNSANFEQDVTGNYTLKVTGDLVIKATGSVTIESGTGLTAKAGTELTAKGGTSVAISSGMDTSVKAGTQLALEGSVTAELKGSAQTAIKGGIVQIN